MDFPDYPSHWHIEKHMEKCLLKHDWAGGSSGSSYGPSRASSGSVEFLGSRSRSGSGSSAGSSVKIIESRSRSSSIEEIPQEPSFLPGPVTGNEVISQTPEIIEIFVV